MKFLSFVIFLTLFMFTSSSYASGFPYKRESRDLKLNTQQLIEFQEIDNAVVADPDRVLVDQASTSASTTTVVSFAAQPDVARALSILPEGTTADVAAMSITVTGTNYNGAVITEAFAFSANASTSTSGLLAFKSVTEVSIPAQDGDGATFDVGVLDVLGLKKCMASDHLLNTNFDNAMESTRATVVYDADEVEKNTIDINGTLDGAKDIDVFFLQNFAKSCQP